MNTIEFILEDFHKKLCDGLNEKDGAIRVDNCLDAFANLKDNLTQICSSLGDAPEVSLGLEFKFSDSRYTRGKNGWLASSLYKQAEEDGLKPFDIPLAGLNLSFMPFKSGNFDSFIWHMKRCMNADINIPIILDDLGTVCDGNHRIARAILEGKKYIKAYRLTRMPPVDFNEDDEED